VQIFPELSKASDVDDSMKRGAEQELARPRTAAQLTFDLVFGIFAPIACFIFDPIVFQSVIGGAPLLPEYQTITYLISGFEIAVLCFWLVFREGPELQNAVIGGALFLGGSFCLVIGIVLLPFSVMGLLVGIGVFGFIPFLTAIVYLRNGLRCLRANKGSDLFTRAAGIICGAIVVLGLPGFLAWQIRSAATRSVDEIVQAADPVRAADATHRLIVLRFLTSAELDRIVQAYVSETDVQRKELLRSSYREITGIDIESRVRILQD
jgi:hypothetical protein